ncbi:MAG: hypothetical protein V7756_07540 [Halopseudomonas sp.]|uniref:hypothetical protein n=1 Tax=Halopseudomonas sp. TaxID=2901191 RepID=UPI0030032FED
MTSGWSCFDLGDGMLAEPRLAELLEQLPKADTAHALFLRRRFCALHCQVLLYCSPALARWARSRGAVECARPSRCGLELLRGSEQEWALLGAPSAIR